MSPRPERKGRCVAFCTSGAETPFLRRIVGDLEEVRKRQRGERRGRDRGLPGPLFGDHPRQPVAGGIHEDDIAGWDALGQPAGTRLAPRRAPAPGKPVFNTAASAA